MHSPLYWEYAYQKGRQIQEIKKKKKKSPQVLCMQSSWEQTTVVILTLLNNVRCDSTAIFPFAFEKANALKINSS